MLSKLFHVLTLAIQIAEAYGQRSPSFQQASIGDRE